VFDAFLGCIENGVRVSNSGVAIRVFIDKQKSELVVDESLGVVEAKALFFEDDLGFFCDFGFVECGV